ncbi:sigma-70 family RNA polymerase sigma factor [Candidatus Falkowbacteria bacterium]|nr:sigma-70 family RNA polymerase sigma factor [Candidatus Falkowbacteria bacterium]
MNDRKLFVKIKKKDKDSFVKAYDMYVEDIHRFVYFKVGSQEEANDITSKVFLKTWGYILKESLDRERSLRALIYKIARNTIIDHYREQSRKSESSIDASEGLSESLVDEKQDLAKALEIDSDIEMIKKALPMIKDEYREVIIMHYINEMSFAEIADITGKSKGNVRVISYRALKALKEIIERSQDQ